MSLRQQLRGVGIHVKGQGSQSRVDIPGLTMGSSPGTRIPMRGRVWYVDPVNGSDSYDGTEPKKALLTTAAALAKCTANYGDVIYRLPGDETLAAILDINVAGVSIIAAPGGAPGMREKGYRYISSTGYATGAAVKITQPCYLYGLTFEGKQTAGPDAQILYVSAGVDPSGAVLENCYFTGATCNYGLEVQGASYCELYGCTIEGTDALLLSCTTGDAGSQYNRFENCVIAGATNSIEKSTGSTGVPEANIWRNCYISGTVDNDTVNLVQVFLGCQINATGVDGFMDDTTTGYTTTVAVGNVYAD